MYYLVNVDHNGMAAQLNRSAHQKWLWRVHFGEWDWWYVVEWQWRWRQWPWLIKID